MPRRQQARESESIQSGSVWSLLTPNGVKPAARQGLPWREVSAARHARMCSGDTPTDTEESTERLAQLYLAPDIARNIAPAPASRATWKHRFFLTDGSSQGSFWRSPL